jgi:hypothetical protein
MEKIPSIDTVQREHDPWENGTRMTKEALAKRAEFKMALKNANTFTDIRAAVEAFSVDDIELGGKQVVNFMEGGIADQNEMDGIESYSDVMRGLSELEKDGASTYGDISDKVFNYAIAGKVAELLNIQV